VSALDFINGASAEYVEELYRRFLQDPSAVDSQWALFFRGFQLAHGNGARSAVAALPAAPVIGVFDLIHSYRELGHLVANLDPLGHNADYHPLLDFAEFGFTDADLDRVVECGSLRIFSLFNPPPGE